MRRRDFLTGTVVFAAWAQMLREASTVAARANAPVETARLLAEAELLTDQDGNQITDEALMAIVVDKF